MIDDVVDREDFWLIIPGESKPANGSCSQQLPAFMCGKIPRNGRLSVHPTTLKASFPGD